MQKNLLKFQIGFLISSLYVLAIPINAEETVSHVDIPYLEISKQAKGSDVILVGEEHDDQSGHKVSLELFQRLSSEFPLTLSLEMLEWHQQESIDEYLQDTITYKALVQHSRFWENFDRDYLPLLEFAKKNQMPIICANPPRKYVNAVARKGMLAYQILSQDALRNLPLPHTVLRDRSSLYEKRLQDLFSEMGGGSSHSTVDGNMVDRLILAQHIWDAGMTEKIATEFYRKDRKIFHLNGRFHSDYGQGVGYRLRKWGLRVTTISLVPKDRWEVEKTKSFGLIADFLILTK
jgi:uncharacterized iron-regulated protein